MPGPRILGRFGGTAKLGGTSALLVTPHLINAAVVNVRAGGLPRGGTWAMTTNANFNINSSTGAVTAKIANIGAGSYSPAITYTVTKNGQTFVTSVNLSITVENVDTSPSPFNFAVQNNVPANTLIQSEVIVISGINSPATITISGNGGQYRISGGAWTSSSGTVVNGDTLEVRQVSGAVNGVSATTVVVGGYSATFNVVVGPPVAMTISGSFADAVIGQDYSSTITINLGVAEINGTDTATLAGHGFSFNGTSGAMTGFPV